MSTKQTLIAKGLFMVFLRLYKSEFLVAKLRLSSKFHNFLSNRSHQKWSLNNLYQVKAKSTKWVGLTSMNKG